MELYKKHRPNCLDQVIGQDSAVAQLRSFIAKKNVPHSILLSGGAGTGKTTLARILANELKAGDDLYEMNSSNFRGIETIRQISQQVGYFALSGGNRVWIMDEVHKLSNDAQNAFLKLLEDTPRHVYFFLATTDPHKLIAPIRNRCTEIKLNPLSTDHLCVLIETVCGREKLKIDSEIRSEIAENVNGSARKALVVLDQVAQTDDLHKQKQIVREVKDEDAGKSLVTLLMNKKTQWQEVAEMLKKENLPDPEGLRRGVKAYCATIMLNAPKEKAKYAYRVFTSFEEPDYDSPREKLIASCWEIFHGILD